MLLCINDLEKQFSVSLYRNDGSDEFVCSSIFWPCSKNFLKAKEIDVIISTPFLF